MNWIYYWPTWITNTYIDFDICMLPDSQYKIELNKDETEFKMC